ncbi:MAG: helix-turn-helix transcriptional regulator [Prevotella sp.]|nr:helix-turn-helix transcriptional regulator [Prevotella sp.]
MGEIINLSIGDFLRRLRLKLGLTQEEVSRHLGISQPAYLKYETGATEVSEEMLRRLAELFQVNADDLVGRKMSVLAADIAFAYRKEKGTEVNIADTEAFRTIVRNYMEMRNELESNQ